MNGNRFLWVLLFAGALFLGSACRLSNLIVQNSSRPPTVLVQAKSQAKTATPSATWTPTKRVPTASPRPVTVVVTDTPTEFPTDFEFPTAEPDSEMPTDVPSDVMPADAQPDLVTPVPTNTVVKSATPTATPTREFPYMVGSSWCGPNVRTFIEGIVFENGEEKDGIIVRISMSPGGDPAPNDDYITGTDPTKPGYYFHNIDVNRPHGGLWYIFLLDPDTKRRISDIATVKTDSIRVEDNDKSAGSCQSAEVNFTTAGYSIQSTATTTRTPTRTGTTTRTATPTPTGTWYSPTPTSTPTATGTPYTATPTPTVTETIQVSP